MIDFNWESAWQKSFDRRQGMYTGESGLGYWESRAEDFSEMRVSKQYEYGCRVLDILEPLLPEQADVLDVGAGPGTFLVPFGPRVRNFTAVEPAENMVKRLRQNAEAADVNNYQVLQVPWQDVDVDRFRKQFDLVVISITLWMFRDVRQQIRRLEKVCRGHCCVVTGAGQNPNGHGPSLWEAIVGDRPEPSYSEFPFIFNLLYNQGRLPEVRTFSHTAERTVASRIRQQKLFYAKYIDLTPSHEEMIQNFVTQTGKGGMVREDYTSAVVWWKAK